MQLMNQNLVTNRNISTEALTLRAEQDGHAIDNTKSETCRPVSFCRPPTLYCDVACTQFKTWNGAWDDYEKLSKLEKLPLD